MLSCQLRMLALVLGDGCGFAPAVTAGADKPRLPVGEFHATKMVKPPTIDGKISPGEWEPQPGRLGLHHRLRTLPSRTPRRPPTLFFAFFRRNEEKKKKKKKPPFFLFTKKKIFFPPFPFPPFG